MRKGTHRHGGKVRQKRKAFMYEAQCGYCFYCGYSLTKEQATMDHFVSFKMGGVNGLANIVIAHYDCNIRKADRYPFPEEVERWRVLQDKLKLMNPKLFKDPSHLRALDDTMHLLNKIRRMLRSS